MRILALTRYERLGSSSRVRFYQYFPYLNQHGVEIVNAPLLNDDYVKQLYTGQARSTTGILVAYLRRLSVLLTGSAYDLLWIEKEIFPWLPAWFEGLLSARKIPYVVDYDDAVYHRYDLHPAALVRSLLGRKIDRVMHYAALVTAGNEYLAGRARQAGARRVEYLPSVVDVQRYARQPEVPRRGNRVRIGWIGSPVTAPYLEIIRDALQLLAREVEFEVVLIGAGEADPLPGLPTIRRPWSEEGELSLAREFDIGVMPLMDGPFERGKCGYKLVQYMAAGLPVVASPVGVNRQIVTPGSNGYLAASSRDWLEALQALAVDGELRLRMGGAGRQKAEQMYNLQGTAPRLLDLLAGARIG